MLIFFTDDTTPSYISSLITGFRGTVADRVYHGDELLKQHLPQEQHNNYILYEASVVLRSHARKDFAFDSAECVAVRRPPPPPSLTRRRRRPQPPVPF